MRVGARRNEIKGRGSSLAQILLFQEQERTRQFNHETQIQQLIQIYQLNKQITTEVLIKEVIPIFSLVPYLSKICPANNSMAQFLTNAIPGFMYEFFPKGDIVFHYMDKGDKFYLILEGKAGVFVPKSQETIKKDNADCDLTHAKQNRQRSKKLLLEDKTILLHTGDTSRYFNENMECKFQRVNELQSFDSFGELSLTTDKPRGATIIALEDLYLLSLTKLEFKRVSERQMQSLNNQFDFFEALFPEISKQKISKVVQYFKEIEFQPNQVIWNEDQVSDFCLVIRQGTVQVMKQNIPKMMYMLDTQQKQQASPKKNKFGGYDRESQMMPSILKCSIVGEKNILGDEELISKCNRLYTCQVLSEVVKAYYLSLEDFYLIGRLFPDIYAIMVERSTIKRKWLLKRQANILSANLEQLELFSQVGKKSPPLTQRVCVGDLEDPAEFDGKYLRSHNSVKPNLDWLVSHKIRVHNRNLQRQQSLMGKNLQEHNIAETFQYENVTQRLKTKIMTRQKSIIDESPTKSGVLGYEVLSRSVIKNYKKLIRKPQQNSQTVSVQFLNHVNTPRQLTSNGEDIIEIKAPLTQRQRSSSIKQSDQIFLTQSLQNNQRNQGTSYDSLQQSTSPINIQSKSLTQKALFNKDLSMKIRGIINKNEITITKNEKILSGSGDCSQIKFKNQILNNL